MSHYAKVVDGLVENVIVAEQDFVDKLEGLYIKTSYNTRDGVHYDQEGQPDNGDALRKNFAAIGMIYDTDRDAFYEDKPYPSWSLNEETCVWEAPSSYPDDVKLYEWEEDTLSWVEGELPDMSDNTQHIPSDV
jgi:hypothetical protein